MSNEYDEAKLQSERQEIEELLECQKKKIGSVFSKELEQRFWLDREDRLTKTILRAIVPAVIAYFIFEFISLPINYFTTEAQYRAHDVLMTLISYTAGWFALGAIYLTVKYEKLRNHYSTLIAVVICITMSIVQAVLFSTQSLAMTWRGTLIIIFALMFAYLCSGLRPRRMFFTGLSSGAIACSMIFMLGKHVPTWVLFNVIILGNLVGLGLSVLMISTERIRFLQSIIIDLDKQLYELLNQHLFKLAQQDTLTGLGNRRRLEQQLAQEFKWVMLYKKPLAILFIDVDFFKLYNDLYGHQHGDVALIHVAQTLLRHTDVGDVAIRYGGEEFVLLITDTTPEKAESIANAILQDVCNQKIEHKNSTISDFLTVSIGLTLYRGEPDVTYQEVLKLADQALYAAKKAGRNRYEILNTHHDVIVE